MLYVDFVYGVSCPRRLALTIGVLVGAIEGVKQFRPELKVEGFRDARNPGVLEDREINGDQVRAVELVPPCVAKNVRTKLGTCRRWRSAAA